MLLAYAFFIYTKLYILCDIDTQAIQYQTITHEYSTVYVT